MSAEHFSAAEAAEDAVRGEARATHDLIAVVGGWANPDALLTSLRDVLRVDGQRVEPSPRLRAWCRAVQKTIERRSA